MEKALWVISAKQKSSLVGNNVGQLRFLWEFCFVLFWFWFCTAQATSSHPSLNQEIKKQQAARQTLVQDKPSDLLTGDWIFCESSAGQVISPMLGLTQEAAKLRRMLQNLRALALFMASSLEDAMIILYFLQKLRWRTISLKSNVSDKTDPIFPYELCTSSINPKELGTFYKEQPNKVLYWVFCWRRSGFSVGCGEEVEKEQEKKTFMK